MAFLPTWSGRARIFFVRVISIASVCLSLLVPACASRAKKEVTAPASDVAELEAKTRRDRRAIRSLENEIALLRARLRDTPQAAPIEPSPTGQIAGESDPGGNYGDGTEPGEYDANYYDDTGAYAEELPDTLASSIGPEVEVIYAGEAAKDVSVRPNLELYETRPTRSTVPEPALPPPPALGEGSGDRLSVVRGPIPTVDAQLRRARAVPHARSTQSVPPRTVPQADSAAPAEARTDAKSEYRRYVEAVRGGNLEYGASGLRSFLDKFPGHDLADNAQYWLAESYYDRKNYSLARVEFEKVIDRYPRGNKVADALLKIGYCHLSAGDQKAGVRVLERLVSEHPRSNPAILAAQRLEELR